MSVITKRLCATSSTPPCFVRPPFLLSFANNNPEKDLNIIKNEIVLRSHIPVEYRFAAYSQSRGAYQESSRRARTERH